MTATRSSTHAPKRVVLLGATGSIGKNTLRVIAAHLPPLFTPLFAAALALPIAVLAIVSDLVESIIKRHTNAKDAGATIPGIGGVFDLSDSLILTAPVGFVVFNLL